MDVRVLGCSGGIGNGLRTTCLRIDHDILIDAGTGLADLYLEDMAEIRHIFLTHSHLDHIAGIPLLVDSIFDQLQRHPLTVHARPETIRAFREHVFNWVVWPDFSVLPNEREPVVRFNEMEPDSAEEIDGRSIEMIPVNHAVPAAGYRIESDGRAMVFSGDTTSNEALWENLNRGAAVDALIVECAFPDSELELSKMAYHYCPSLLAADLKKLEKPCPIYISHLKPGAEERIVNEVRDHCPGLDILRLSDGDHIPL